MNWGMYEYNRLSINDIVVCFIELLGQSLYYIIVLCFLKIKSTISILHNRTFPVILFIMLQNQRVCHRGW